MDNPGYVSLARQSGLMKELTIIANNIANANTAGFKREGAVFTEYVNSVGNKAMGADPEHSLSMGQLGAHYNMFDSGELRRTGGDLDVAVEGDGFFMVEAPGGERLTRAGHFMTNAERTLVTADGMPVLDAGGANIQIPQEAKLLQIATDGTLSADGVAFGQLGLVTADQETLAREGNNLWIAREGTRPIEDPKILQGFIEDSNVSPVAEIARMIEVQRAYDAGQKLLEMEDERIKQVTTAIRQLT